MPRLHAHCRNCDRTGLRSEFFRDRPGTIPAFIDQCPHCQSDNVDVIDVVAHDAAARADLNGTPRRSAA